MTISLPARNPEPSDPLAWPADTELVGLVFEVQSASGGYLYPQYPIALHAWFLDQARSYDPKLSAYLHDGESEKPFTISGLEGQLATSGKQLRLLPRETYYWYVTALSPKVVQWMQEWLRDLPEAIALRQAPLEILSVRIVHPATTYAQLLDAQLNGDRRKSLPLSFLTPTSFRRKGHHLPLPWPTNVFHSYLRRWNNFSNLPASQDEFLQWVDDSVLIARHKLESVKVPAGKKGLVTGFTGSIEFSLTREARQQMQFEKLFYALGQLAPYCGTGHKTTFGLGQTRLGWLSKPESSPTISVENQLADRIEELTEMLMADRKRPGGDRALQVAETRATILARREFGESLQDIAADLDLPYETVKTYAKLARKAVK